MIIKGPIIIKGFPRNSYIPFPWIVQIFPAGTPQFPVLGVFMVKTFAVHSSSQQKLDQRFYVLTLNFEIPQVAYF
jgi:hypothetical protein